MPFRIELLFVTTVSNFLGLDLAVSNANRMILSMPTRVKIAVSVAVSHGCLRWVRPPCPAYSPSEFSRTMIQSMSLSLEFFSAQWVPGNVRMGRTLA